MVSSVRRMHVSTCHWLIGKMIGDSLSASEDSIQSLTGVRVHTVTVYTCTSCLLNSFECSCGCCSENKRLFLSIDELDLKVKSITVFSQFFFLFTTLFYVIHFLRRRI